MILQLTVGVRCNPAIVQNVIASVGVPSMAFTSGEDYHLEWKVSSVRESTALLARANAAVLRYGHVIAETVDSPQCLDMDAIRR